MVIVSNVMRAGHDRESCYRKTNRKNAIMQTIDEVKRRADEGISDLDDQKEAILRELEELRSKRRMMVADVAALLGRAPSYYSVMLNRGRSLSLDSLAKIAALFNRKIELRLVRRKGRSVNVTRLIGKAQ